MKNNSISITRFTPGKTMTRTIISVIFTSDEDADEPSFIAVSSSDSVKLFTLPKHYNLGIQYFSLEGTDLFVQLIMKRHSAELCNVVFGKMMAETECTLIKEY